MIAQDTFTDFDGTNLTAHTMNIGVGWTALIGAMNIQSNVAQCQSATTAYVTQCNRSDVTINCDIRCGLANAFYAPSILLRAHDNNNYIQAYFSGDGTFAIYKRIGGTLSLVNGGGVWSADTNWHSVQIICKDTHIIVYLDTVLLWEGDVPTLVGGTKFGMLGFVLSGNKDAFDNFVVTADSEDEFPGEFVDNSFIDTFTQANGTRLNMLGWTENAGTWEVNSNKARQILTSSPANGYIVLRDIGVTDFGLEVEITTPATGGFICGLVFRAIDKNHYIECEINTNSTQGGFAIWYTKNSGSFIELARQNAQVFTPANNTTYTMRARIKGHLIICELVEAGLKLATYCDQFLNATKVGLFEARSTTTYANPNLYDNFKIYE